MSIENYYLERWRKKQDWTKIGKSKQQRLINFIRLHDDYVKNKSVKIIDYGCGSGWLFHYLYELNFNNLYGFDVTPSTLDLVIKKFPFVKKIWSTHGDFETNLPNNFFDICISSEVYEHIPYNKKEDFLKIVYEILNDNGYLYLTTPNGKYKNKMLNIKDAQPIEDWHTPKEVEKVFKNSGFSLIKKGSFYFSSKMSLWHKLCCGTKVQKIYKTLGVKDNVYNILDKKMMGLSTYYFLQKKQYQK